MEKRKINKIKSLEKIKEITNTKKLKFFEFEDFLNVSEKIEDYLSEFTDEIEELLPQDIDTQSINFLLYEILINVYKHSKFQNGFINIEVSEMICITLIDDGIGIPGSFKESSIEFEDDSEAIFEALNGKTTDKEKYSLHGRGLNSTARITTLGFEGEMIILSGNGVCIATKKGIETLENKDFIAGTQIRLKINSKKIKNIYEYLKYERINKINEAKL